MSTETRNPYLWGVLMLSAVGLSSCSTAKTKADCEETNYYQLGLEDGKAGKSSDRLNQIANECSKFGIEAASPQYGYGRQAGLKEFCSESHARDDAKAGKSDSICWQESFPGYQTAYREALGKRQSDKQEDLRKSVANQATARQRSEALNSELQQIENQKSAH